MADSPYFDDAYFDPTYFDTDAATGGEGRSGRPTRRRRQLMRQVKPPVPEVVDEDWVVLIT